jgi:serine protease Do
MAAAMAATLGPLAIPIHAQAPPDQRQGLAKAQPASPIQLDPSPLQRTTGEISSFAPIVDKVGPSVVTVFTSKEVKPDADAARRSRMLRRFFNVPDDGSSDGSDGEGGKVEGLGSGVIISPDGLILTNNHVADAGDQIMVRIGDHGREYSAKVVGKDPSSDVAILRIDAKNLPVMTFADSDQVKVGDVVLAMGNPFGLTNTVTHGIVSAVGRNGMGIERYENFIQTDASINPGNSGGALVDTEGRLIGMNTAIFSDGGGNQGIGFAVPSNMLRTVVDSLLKNGKVTRGFLGAGIESLTPDLAGKFGVPEDQQGVIITDVAPFGTPGAAAAAGLKDGDIVTSVGGKQVADANALRLAIGGMSPGDRVALAYLRNGQSSTAEATLGQATADGKYASSEPAQPVEKPAAPQSAKPNVLDGITVGDLDASARASLKVPADLKGVVVVEVTADSVGGEAGLQKGDVILDMNHKPLTSADEAIDEGNKIEKTDAVLLHVWSQGQSDYVVLKPREG